VLVSDPVQFKSYDSIVELDQQLLEVMDKLPWYFQLEENGMVKQFPATYDFLAWQNHILRTYVSTQRVRMYRPFLTDHKSNAFQNCIKAVEDALAVYRSLRATKPLNSQQKYFPQAYQIFSVAVTLATLLLVERSIPNPGQARIDVETMAADLGLLEAQACPVPVAVNGRKVLLKVLALFEQGESCSPEDAERLVPDISTILGGENSTRAYLGRRALPGSTEPMTVDRGAPAPQNGLQVEQSVTSENAPRLDVTGVLVENEDMSLPPLTEVSDGAFDFEDFQLGDSFDLFGWDMTGLLSDVVAFSRQ